MARGSTQLDNFEYDDYLAKTKNAKELVARKVDRRNAVKRDGSGYYFNIDDKPVKVKDLSHLRVELEKRGLAIEGEYRGKKK